MPPPAPMKSWKCPKCEAVQEQRPYVKEVMHRCPKTGRLVAFVPVEGATSE